MADQRGTLDRLAEEAGYAFAAFEDLFDPENTPTLFIELGLDPAVGVTPDAPFLQVLADTATQAIALSAATSGIVAASESGDTTATIQAALAVVAAIERLAIDLDAIATDLARLGSGSADAAAIGAFALTFAERALEDAVIRYLGARHPLVLEVLQLLGIAVITPIALPQEVWNPSAPYAPAGTSLSTRELHLERLGLLSRDALAYAQTTYGWGTEGFDAAALFTRLATVLNAIGPLASVDDGLEDVVDDDNDDPTISPPKPPILDIFALAFTPTSDAHPPGVQGQLYVDVVDALDITLARFGDAWRVAVQLDSEVGAGLGIRVVPPAKVRVASEAEVKGEAAIALVGQAADPGQPFLIFGETGGSRLQAASVRAALFADFRWDALQNQASSDLGFELKVAQSKGIIDTSGSDSFLHSILPANGLSFGFDFRLTWSVAKGLTFTGSAGLETALALNLALGPLHLSTIHLALAAGDTGLGVETSIDGSAHLGPITVSVERIGVKLDLAFTRGNLGPVDLAIGFKAPTGLGISVDAGPIQGGGFLELDPANGRYSGMLALTLYGVQVTAIGLLDTKLPNAQPGFSFLIVISVKFTPIELGLGFTLNGVGGLCGIHRSVVSDAIQAGLRAHSLDGILFPPDPIANAPAIISELRTIFPPTQGRYVFGPMVQLGWGGELRLVTAELAVLLTLPAPAVISILGQLHVILPNPTAAIVALHLDVLGNIDFGKKRFSLDGALHDSRVAALTISGDFAMRLDWGDNPSFALSIGGLNPHFQPPDGFPQLQRLVIALSATSALTLTVQSYLAITSNTFQFGAKCELTAKAGSLNVYGWLGFDALLVFSPFLFDVDFTAGLALRHGTSTLMGISVEGDLSGPTPWHVTGKAHISLLFFSISVNVDFTWGNWQQVSAPPTDAWPPLKAALADVRNWSGSMPTGIPAPVTLASPSTNEVRVYVDPSSVLTLRERVLPLDQTLTKFGEALPGPQTTFTLSSVTVGGASLPFTRLVDKFAPAQFEALSYQEKLSRPSFDDGVAGFTAGAGAIAFGAQFGLNLAYVDLYDDPRHTPRPEIVHYTPTAAQQIQWSRSNGAVEAGRAMTPLGAFAPPAGTAPLVTFGNEQFVIATTDDLVPRADLTAPVSKGEAIRTLAAHLDRNPNDRDALQVVPLHELAA